MTFLSDYGGGVCDNFRTVDGQNKSLNTGVVTFTHNGMRLPEEVTQFAFVHELGHSYGSPVRMMENYYSNCKFQ